MTETEEQKQNYLRENILEKGYEAEDFVTYLTSKKGDEGINLSNWSLEELKSVVQEYISNNPLNNKQEVENNNIIQSNNNIQNNLVQNPILAENLNNLNNLNSLDNTNNPQGMNPFPNILLNNDPNNNMININNINNMNLEPNLLNSNLTNDINSGNVFLPKDDNTNLINSQGEQTDIYGITNTEIIYCLFS